MSNKGYKPMHPRKRMERIVRDAEQFVRDVEWWNRNRTDAEPMDCESMRIVLRDGRRALAAWDRGDVEEYKRISGEMAAYMTRAARDGREEGL